MTNKRTILKGAWRNLKCVECGQHTGFTRADLDQVMCPDYKKHFHCGTCEKCTDQEFYGPPYIMTETGYEYLELNFESVTNE